MKWMVTEVIQNNNNEFLITKLQSGISIWTVSDGYYHPTYKYGTSTWIIKIQKNDRTIIGANVVPGDAKSQCSHRSEPCGLIGAIRHINNIFITCNVFEGSIDLGRERLEAY